jgi:hypothetical protein
MPVGRAFRERDDARKEREKRLAPLMSALSFVIARSHPELRNETLVADRLSVSEGEELVALVKKARALVFEEGAEPLTEAEQERYGQLLGIVSGDPTIFERKRREAASKAKLAELANARRRHPQAESVVAAVMGDPDLFDLLGQRIRRDVRLYDEYGNVSKGTTVEPILELDHIGVLFTIVSLIAENGGREIRLNQHGAPVGRKAEDGRLPFLPVKTLGQLRRNGFLSVRSEGTDFLICLGPRTRKLAARWEIR